MLLRRMKPRSSRENTELEVINGGTQETMVAQDEGYATRFVNGATSPSFSLARSVAASNRNIRRYRLPYQPPVHLAFPGDQTAKPS